MIAAISTAFVQLFAVLTGLCGVALKTTKALDNLATVAEESSGAYADESRAEREAKLAVIRANRAKNAVALPAADTAAIPKLGA